MTRTYEGALDAQDLRMAIVVARFNELITEKLLDGALETARESGASMVNVDVTWVPGAFELPLAARVLENTGRYDGVVCLGAVIRGETPHFELVAGEATRGIGEVAADFAIPVTFGVITSDTVEQARARSGGSAGNKGRDAMLAAIEMANLLPTITRRSAP